MGFSEHGQGSIFCSLSRIQQYDSCRGTTVFPLGHHGLIFFCTHSLVVCWGLYSLMEVSRCYWGFCSQLSTVPCPLKKPLIADVMISWPCKCLVIFTFSSDLFSVSVHYFLAGHNKPGAISQTENLRILATTPWLSVMANDWLRGGNR